MRVTILGRDFPPAIGGIGDHTDLLAAELARLRQHVTVLCGAPAESRDTFDVRAVLTRWDRNGHAAIVDAVEQTTPDVIVWQYNPFAVGPRGVAGGAATLARELARCAPLIAFAHELWFPWGRDGLRGLVWASAQRIQTRGVLRACATTIVTTEARERDLARKGIGRVRRIPVGTNVIPSGAPGRERFGIAGNAFVLGHLGSAGPGRDLAPAREAIAALREHGTDARLLLIGNTGPIEASADGSVISTGLLSRSDLSDALFSCDAYLHADPVGPSVGRRGSLVAALAHGLPLIAYRGPDAAPQLIDGRSVLFTERNASALTRTLETLAADPARRRALGDAARAVHDEEFAWDVLGKRIVEVLEESAG